MTKFEKHQAWQLYEADQAVISLQSEIARLRTALTEIDAEATGALNNAFHDEAPEVIAHIRGIACRALKSLSQAGNSPAGEIRQTVKQIDP